MINSTCQQCGLVSDFAAEVCPQCGAELTESAKTFYRGVSDPEPQLPLMAGHEGPNDALEFTPAIGPFLSLGSVLSPTVSIFTSNVWLITKIVLVVFAPLEIFKSLSIGNNPSWQVGVGTFLLGLFCKALVAPSLIFALLTQMRTGVAPSLNESYRWGLSRLGKLVPAAVMTWFLVAVGTLCLVIPGLILGAAFELVYPMAALENLGPVEILKRSYHLTKGHRWNIFWSTFLLGILAAIVTIPVTMVSTLLIPTGAGYWPLQAALAIINDFAAESMTVLSLVIYLSILNHSPSE